MQASHTLATADILEEGTVVKLEGNLQGCGSCMYGKLKGKIPAMPQMDQKSISIVSAGHQLPQTSAIRSADWLLKSRSES